MRRPVSLAIYVALVSVLATPASYGQFQEEATIAAATAVLTETMGTPLNRIPEAMLSNANGVAIIPNVLKGSFIVGARHGRGLLFVREPKGTWHAPVFITLTGGNIGWQVGVQSSDIVLVFKTPQSIQGILSGKLTIGADAAAAAGPVGRQGAVATDGQLQAEIYSYSRSRGLFAGVSVDGSVVQVDRVATGNYYRSPGPGQPVVVPVSAQQLTQAIASYAGHDAAATSPQNPAYAQQYRSSETDELRTQLVQITPRLFDILDENWKAYLALPSSLYLGNEHPDAEAIKTTLDRFNAVAADARFQTLATRPEFQSVHALLKHYQQSMAANSAALVLPPPPGAPNEVLPP
jgi:SH3 domain-containing YSC84-like protein 1